MIRTVARLLPVCFCLLMSASARAGERLAIDVTLAYTSFLLFEPVRVEIRITNTGDIPLTIGPSPLKNSWEVDFSVWRSNERLPLDRVTRRAMAEGKTIGVDETLSLLIDLSEFYDLFEEGNYQFQCHLVSGDVKLTSRLMSFGVVRGIELKRVEQALPGYAGEPRVYSLRYWRRGNREKLFLVVDAPFERMNYGVFDLGALIRLTPPELTVSRDGLVTVVHTYGDDVYVRSTLRSERNGVVMVDQTFLRRGGVPVQRRSATEATERALERVGAADEAPSELKGWWLLDNTPIQLPPK